MSISFQNAVPSEYLMKRPVTTSKSILNKRQHMFYPETQEEYSSTGNRVIRFEISSNTSMLSFPESHFSVSLTTSDAVAYHELAGSMVNRLGKGGLHSIWRRIYVEDLANNRIVEDIDHYNIWYAVNSLLKDEPQSLTEMGHIYGDSLEFEHSHNINKYMTRVPLFAGAGNQLVLQSQTNGSRQNLLVVRVVHNVQINQVENVASQGIMGVSPQSQGFEDLKIDHGDQQAGVAIHYPLPFTQALTNLAVGEMVEVLGKNALVRKIVHTPSQHHTDYHLAIPFRLNAVRGDPGTVAYIDLTNDKILAANEMAIYVRSAADSDHLSILSPDTNITNVKQNPAYGVTLHFMPMLAWFQYTIPLFVTKSGFRIVFELDDRWKYGVSSMVLTNRVITVGNGAAVAVVPTYSSNQAMIVKQMRFVAMLTDPEKEIHDEYFRTYQSAEGLIYPIPGVMINVHSNQAAVSNKLNLQIRPGLRSARRIFVVQLNQKWSQQQSDQHHRVDGISTFLRGGIKNYQFRVGTHDFPRQAVDLTRANNVICTYGYQGLEQIYKVIGKRNIRLNPTRYYATYPTIMTASQLNKHDCLDSFVMCADLARDQGEGAGLTGLDLTVMNLELNAEREGTWTDYWGADTAVMFLSFIEYDQFYKLQQTDSQVIR